MLDQTIEAAEDRVSAGAALAVSFARSSAEVLEAQRLRCRLFAEEMGARIPGVALGTDCDLYDAHCQNLLVRDTGSGEVVCTYRLLQGQKEREIGRSCVHPDYRTGTTIALLW